MAKYKVETEGGSYIVETDDGGSQSQPQQQPQMEQQKSSLNLGSEQSNAKLLQALLIAGGAATGVGLYNAGEPGRQLKAQQKGLLGELTGMQKQLGIEGTEPTFVPKKLSEMQSQIQRDAQRQISKINYDTDLAVKNHKMAMDEFDSKLLNSNVSDLSKTVKDNFPQLQKNVSKAYKAGMEGIEGFLEKSGVKLNAVDFNTQVIDKTISQALATGSLPDEVSNLIKIKNMTFPKSESGVLNNIASETPTSFSQLKGFVSNVVSQDPHGKVSTMLRQNWGEFLQNNSPPEVQQQLSKLNSSFKPFAEARTKLSQIMDTRTGEFDYKGLNKYFLDYTKSNIDNGTENLMKLIGEGNDLVTKIEGVLEKFNNLTELKGQRSILKATLLAIKQTQQEALNQVASKAQAEIDKIIANKSKANELISKLMQNQENIAKTRLLGIPNQITKLGARLAGKSIGFMSIAPMIMQAAEYSKDPQAVMVEMLGGKLAPQGSMERDIQTGQLT